MVSLENRTIYIGVSNCSDCDICKIDNPNNYFEMNKLPTSIRHELKKQIYYHGLHKIRFPLCVVNGKIVFSGEQNKIIGIHADD